MRAPSFWLSRATTHLADWRTSIIGVWDARRFLARREFADERTEGDGALWDVLCNARALSPKVDKLLRQYEGRYAELFRKLEAKYSRVDPRKQVGNNIVLIICDLSSPSPCYVWPF